MKKSLHIAIALGFGCLIMVNAQQSEPSSQAGHPWPDWPAGKAYR